MFTLGSVSTNGALLWRLNSLAPSCVVNFLLSSTSLSLIHYQRIILWYFMNSLQIVVICKWLTSWNYRIHCEQYHRDGKSIRKFTRKSILKWLVSWNDTFHGCWNDCKIIRVWMEKIGWTSRQAVQQLSPLLHIVFSQFFKQPYSHTFENFKPNNWQTHFFALYSFNLWHFYVVSSNFGF